MRGLDITYTRYNDNYWGVDIKYKGREGLKYGSYKSQAYAEGVAEGFEEGILFMQRRNPLHPIRIMYRRFRRVFRLGGKK